MRSESRSILRPGRNCWRVEPAARVKFLVDGAAYFRAFREVALRARHAVYIVAWDIYSELRLVRDGNEEKRPVRLRDLLNHIGKQQNGPHVYILEWDFVRLYATDREWLPAYKLNWTTHSRLRDSDRHRRLRAFYPYLPGLHPHCVNVHAKVMIDERLVRVGSANLNNRSMGLDTECDLAIESHGDPRTEGAIGDFRSRLLAEHLDCDPDSIRVAAREGASLIETIAHL
jgi:phosphatidylserine/phosphatidylglycerophosphate/cardiolipin synthase-like enzyme